jgi:hypothetical protein
VNLFQKVCFNLVIQLLHLAGNTVAAISHASQGTSKNRFAGAERRERRAKLLVVQR